MTTLVTGAGMIGSLTAQRVAEHHDDDVVLLDVAFDRRNVDERVTSDRVTFRSGDVTDLSDVLRTISDHGVDRIAHTAALVTSAVATRPYAGARVNFLGTLSVLEAARIAGVSRFVQCSSATVLFGLLGLDGSATLPEDFSMKVMSEYPPSLYASMKLACEWAGHCYADAYGVDALSVRFAGVFGPWHGTPGGGPSKLFKHIIEAGWRDEPAPLSQSDVDMPPRDYTYAADGAQAVAAALFAEQPTQRVYNASMGGLYDFRDIADAVERRLGRRIELDVRPSPGMQKYTNPTDALDLTASRKDLGFEPAYPMDAAVDDYVAWLDRTHA